MNTVWWAWTASETGSVTISTAGSPLDTVLAVYTGTPESLEYVTENDDASEAPWSEVAFDAVAGQTYYISVDGADYLTGAITLNLPDAPTSPPPANTAPDLGNLAVPLAENRPAGTVVADLDATDPDAGQTLTYAITGGNTNGAFAINPSTGVISVANPGAVDYEATRSFALTVTGTDNGALALSDTATVTVTLANRNDAPVLDAAGPVTLAAINRGEVTDRGTRVADLAANAGITDQDAGARGGIAVVGANTTHGSWQFSTNGGFTWSSLGAVSGSSARLLAADANTRVRFVPNAGYEGTVTGGLTFRAWDRTTGSNGRTANVTANLAANGASSSFSAATETADITVRSIAEQLQLLNDRVQALVTGGTLNAAQGNSLRAKLGTAQQQLGRGNTTAALNALKGFTTQTIVLAFTGNLPLAQGLELLDSALTLRTSILS